MQIAKTIMIVDDDADDRNLFYEALMEVDPSCQFISACNGEHALETLQSPGFTLPDFIFLDLNMPRMNGWQCLENLRKNKSCAGIPVIIYTTSQASEDDEKAKEPGAVYFLTKPNRFKDLVHGISCVMNQEWEKVRELNKMLSTSKDSRS
jgi:CheY-like chemotaxis protein